MQRNVTRQASVPGAPSPQLRMAHALAGLTVTVIVTVCSRILLRLAAAANLFHMLAAAADLFQSSYAVRHHDTFRQLLLRPKSPGVQRPGGGEGDRERQRERETDRERKRETDRGRATEAHVSSLGRETPSVHFGGAWRERCECIRTLSVIINKVMVWCSEGLDS